MKNIIKKTLNILAIIFIISGGILVISLFTQVFMNEFEKARKLEQENNKILLEMRDRIEYLEQNQKLEPLPSR